MSSEILQEKVTPFCEINKVVHPSGFIYYEALHVFKHVPNRPQETLVREVGNTPQQALKNWMDYAENLGFFTVATDA